MIATRGAARRLARCRDAPAHLPTSTSPPRPATASRRDAGGLTAGSWRRAVGHDGSDCSRCGVERPRRGLASDIRYARQYRASFEAELREVLRGLRKSRRRGYPRFAVVRGDPRLVLLPARRQAGRRPVCAGLWRSADAARADVQAAGYDAEQRARRHRGHMPAVERVTPERT